ncbi:MAG TPA: hypothetical protein VHM88_00285 [Candidatus Acidoferrales bacterium]|jgi:hypothetical protein|nr:hypothetical protein [Candidatus Acidoferrales bacterium]
MSSAIRNFSFGTALPTTSPILGMKWARIAELEMALDGKKIAECRATARIYFDVER